MNDEQAAKIINIGGAVTESIAELSDLLEKGGYVIECQCGKEGCPVGTVRASDHFDDCAKPFAQFLVSLITITIMK